MATKIQLRRGTASQWYDINPILSEGELGIETDTRKIKIGTGANWRTISYANVVPSDLNTTLNGYLQTTDLGDTVAELVEGNVYVPGLAIVFEGTVDDHVLVLQSPDVTEDRTVTIPNATTTLVGRDTSDTLTNKSISGSTNTLTNIGNASLTNSSITINGTTVSLGNSGSIGTDAISEGSTNKYFTDDRAQDAVAAALAAGTHTNISVSYDDNAGSISLTGAQTYSNEDAVDAVALAISNGTHTNISVAYDDANNAISFTGAVTYTDEKAQDAVAAALAAGTHTNISVSYDDNTNSISLTGAVTYTDENAQDAVGNAVGNGLDYDDNTGAISVDPSEFALSAVGAPTSDISMATYKITNLGTPTSANDAANKAYVDNTTAGLNFHAAVHAATDTNLDATYNNGTSGVGATLTANSNGALVVDGHTMQADERVLVKSQTAGAENGIYVVTATGDGSNPYVLTRATDADNSPSGEIAYGDFCFVQSGSTYAGYGYIVNTTGTITVGTTSISYVQFNAGQTVIAGNGLTESSPGTFAINTAVTVDLNTAQTLTNKTITGTFSGNITGNVTGDVSGNAGTVTNGVYTSGTYSNPSWITGLAWSKISSAPLTTPTATTVTADTATQIDSTSLSGFTTAKYTVSIKQGSKVRSSEVIVHTDGTSVDMSEFGIIETGGIISGVSITAVAESGNAVLNATITDASSTNATVKLIKTVV